MSCSHWNICVYFKICKFYLVLSKIGLIIFHILFFSLCLLTFYKCLFHVFLSSCQYEVFGHFNSFTHCLCYLSFVWFVGVFFFNCRPYFIKYYLWKSQEPALGMLIAMMCAFISRQSPLLVLSSACLLLLPTQVSVHYYHCYLFNS